MLNLREQWIQCKSSPMVIWSFLSIILCQMLMIGIAAAVKNDWVFYRNLSPFISDLFLDNFKLLATELFNMGVSKKLIIKKLIPIRSALLNRHEKIIASGWIQVVTYIFCDTIINIERVRLSVRRAENMPSLSATRSSFSEHKGSSVFFVSEVVEVHEWLL